MTPFAVRNAAAFDAASDLTHRLAVPPHTPAEHRWRTQSLAEGAAGTALLHVEHARLGLAGWDAAHAWLAAATSTSISSGEDACLFYGAPAVAFALNAAGPGRYPHALAQLDAHISGLTHRRVDHALARINERRLPAPAEFDLIYGLTGIAAHLLRHAPADHALERALGYLVRLTEPLRIDGEDLPGWWTGHEPDFTPSLTGGHANFGMAHGIAGPLALLAHTARHGVSVPGQHDAVERICRWLDAWRQETETGPWWPQWISRNELHARRPNQPEPLRPSWCYGTPGIARAQQLAAIATGDTARRHLAERALVACLSDPHQLGRITDASLCHGWAGLHQTVWHAARDALAPGVAARLPHVTELLVQRGHDDTGEHTGLLEGNAGIALALHTAAHDASSLSGWDTCLLIN